MMGKRDGPSNLNLTVWKNTKARIEKESIEESCRICHKDTFALEFWVVLGLSRVVAAPLQNSLRKYRNVCKDGLTPANAVNVKVFISMHYHQTCNNLVSVFSKADSLKA